MRGRQITAAVGGALAGCGSWQLILNTDLDGFQKSLRSCALDESSLSIGRVKP